MYRFYSTQEKNTARATIVGSYENGQLKIAASRCSVKDQFHRKKGRLMAEGRLQKGKIHSSHNLPNCDITTFVSIAKQIAKQIIADPRTLFKS